jgi:hypothetical protein
MLQKTSQNADDMEELAKRIAGMISFLENSKRGERFPAVVVARLDHMME